MSGKSTVEEECAICYHLLRKGNIYVYIYVYKLLFTNRITTLKWLPMGEGGNIGKGDKEDKFSEYTLYTCDFRIM